MHSSDSNQLLQDPLQTSNSNDTDINLDVLSNSTIIKNPNLNSQKLSYVDNNQISNFSFQTIEKLDNLINSNQYDKIDNFIEDYKQLSLFLNYFSGFIGYAKITNVQNQNVLTNVLSFLIFRDSNVLQSFVTLAINLLVGGAKRQFSPSKTQQLIAMRYFLQYFNEKWFNIKYSETDSLPIAIFKSMSAMEDAGYFVFLNAVAEKIPPNSKYISDFIETLFNSPVISPLQFKFVDFLTRKSPQNPPYYSILFFIKHSIDGIFTRISHHYLIPLILDFYNSHEVLRITVWHYVCRLVQFCITVECLKKQQKIMNDKIKSASTLTYASSQPSTPFYNSLVNSVISQNSSTNEILFLHTKLGIDTSSESDLSLNDSSSNEENSLSQSYDYLDGVFDDLDNQSNIVTQIIDLLHLLYALRIPLLCRTIYMEIRCAQLGFNFFKKEKFNENYVILTISELKQAQLIELPKSKDKNTLTNPKSEDLVLLQKQKELYYIQHYLYDKQLLKDFHRIRPREINLKRLLEFPTSEIPLKKGIKKPKCPVSKPKQSSKADAFNCTSLASSLYGSSIKPKSNINLYVKSSDKPQNNDAVIRTSPMMRLRQYFSRESTSASAE